MDFLIYCSYANFSLLHLCYLNTCSSIVSNVLLALGKRVPSIVGGVHWPIMVSALEPWQGSLCDVLGQDPDYAHGIDGYRIIKATLQLLGSHLRLTRRLEHPIQGELKYF